MDDLPDASARSSAPPERPRVAAVFDIDGVLADVRHRLHHVTQPPKDWQAFFAAAPQDPVLRQGLAAVVAAAAAGRVIVYLTGRPERCRTDTLDWIAAHGLPPGELYMRGDADRRPARLTKVATLRQLAGRMRIGSFVDDDAAVVEVVRGAGFPVTHATWMEPSTSGADSAPEPDPHLVLFEIQESEGRT
jgi:hypothetical protein